jgi:hypothetical protein
MGRPCQNTILARCKSPWQRRIEPRRARVEYGGRAIKLLAKSHHEAVRPLRARNTMAFKPDTQCLAAIPDNRVTRWHLL